MNTVDSGALESCVPMIVSIDDHVVEPPHLWQTWLPEKFRERGPRVERHRLGELGYTGGTHYEYDIDPLDGSGDPCDIWFYEDRIHPNILERADTVWEEQRAWAGTKELVPEPPSTYWYRQGFGCFFRDQHGIDSLDKIGVDNVTFETDYPHTYSTWPNTVAVVEEMFADLSDDVVHKIVRGNALRMRSLDQ